MTFRSLALFGALALALSACPNPPVPDDAGNPDEDGGVIPTGGCSGGCGANLVCDEATHQCVPGCNPACGAGQLCIKSGEAFSCITPATTCSGNVCGEGQSTCVQGNCSCQPFTQALRDTCADQGMVCHAPYNAGTQTGGECDDPGKFEFCGRDCLNQDCGNCGEGLNCHERLFDDFGICARVCDAMIGCGPDELCWPNPAGSKGFCYPASLFNGGDLACQKFRTLEDGGVQKVRVPAPELCLKVDNDGNPTEAAPSGTCTWTFFRTDTSNIAFTYCRSQGPVPEFGSCKTEPLPFTLTSTCGTGLECVPTTAGDGICQRICNAKPNADGTPRDPACNMGEACANLYRRDDNAVVGACMTTCNVFDPATNFGCPDYGTRKTSCVPTTASGVQLISASGDGLCIAQRELAAAEGANCVETDPLKGAACQSGLVCSQVSGAAQPTCVKPCDIGCVPGDGGALPARCSTEANATCGGGRTCSRISSTSGATLGFCL